MIMNRQSAALAVAVTTAGVAHVPRVDTQEARQVLTQAQQQAPPTSYELTDNALAKRVIDAETAHKYRVFAAFGDSRLPAAHKGDDSRLNKMPPSVMRVGTLLTTFSPLTRAELEPFFKRPDEPGSWLELATADTRKDEAAQEHGPNDGSGELIAAGSQIPVQWDSVSAANGLVRVKVHVNGIGDFVKAQAVAQAITSLIWPKLTGLFWAPVRDPRFSGAGQTGPIFVVYLCDNPNQPIAPVPWVGGSFRVDKTNECVNSPRYIGMDSRYPVGGPGTPGIVQGIANFLTESILVGRHLRQGNCAQYDWILEATCRWADQFVYPDAQTEHAHAEAFLDYPAQSLDAVTCSGIMARMCFPSFCSCSAPRRRCPSSGCSVN